MFTIYLDNSKFMLTEYTINKYPHSLLAKIINDQIIDPFIVKKGNNIYIDRDPLIFNYIVDTYRGYKTNLENETDTIRKENVLSDFKYFGLHQEVVSLELPEIDLEVDDNYEYSNNKCMTDILFQELLNKQDNKVELNKEQLENYIVQITEQLKTDNVYDVIQQVSNNETIKELINRVQQQQQQQQPESDVESVELTDDND